MWLLPLVRPRVNWLERMYRQANVQTRDKQLILSVLSNIHEKRERWCKLKKNNDKKIEAHSQHLNIKKPDSFFTLV